MISTTQTAELVRFDLDQSRQVAQELKLDGVVEQLAKKLSAPTTMREFLTCFTQKSAEDAFLKRYLEQL